MVSSQNFCKKAKKLVKEESLTNEEIIKELKILFVSSLIKLYDEFLLQDLFDWQVQKFSSQLYELIDRVRDIIDFLHNKNDNISFSDEEKDIIINLVDESAHKLSLAELTQLMNTLIRKGFF